MAIGIAIIKYNNEDGDNKMLKVHKIGIRKGNYDMQFKNLKI